MHYEILDDSRRNILPQFTFLKTKGFYLAGGTALALHFGHRDSLDFDFFKEEAFDTQLLFEELRQIFLPHRLTIIAEEKNTLTILIDNSIKVSFFSYPYKIILPLIEEPFLLIASIEDIACMKLGAITGRATMKDYVDLYFILKTMSLSELFGHMKKKLPQLDISVVLKSMVYFDDVPEESLRLVGSEKISFAEVKKTLIETVKKYQR